MKRLAIAVSIIILLAIFSSCFPVLAQPAHIPHQNPAAAKVSPGLASLLLFYGNVFELAATSQYQDAQSMLNELKHANIPDEPRYIIDRYNSLAQQLLTTLDNLELLLNDASTLLAHYQIGDAKQKLDEAEAIVHSAQFLLGDIEAATITVSVANTGGTEGSYSVVLKINGVKEAEKSVTIPAGESQDVSFAVAKEEAGSYSVVVDGLRASFTIVAAPPPPTAPPVAPPEVEEVPEAPAKPPINWPMVVAIIVEP